MWSPHVHVADSARKHKITDLRILHAYHHAVAKWEVREDFTMLLGPDQSGHLLEIGVVRLAEDDYLIVHAMRARYQYRRLLRQRR